MMPSAEYEKRRDRVLRRYWRHYMTVPTIRQMIDALARFERAVHWFRSRGFPPAAPEVSRPTMTDKEFNEAAGRVRMRYLLKGGKKNLDRYYRSFYRFPLRSGS
jgi:hypothetical protein